MATGVQGEQTRALVARTEALAMRILDLRIHTYYIKDQMVKVQEKMRAEKEAGLEEISTELDSDSRSFAIDMVSLYLESGTIKSEVFQLYVDRLAALSAGVDGSEITKDICTLISTIDGALSDSPDRVPDLLMFAYGERLKY